jgi:CelD/BcsL family acetyltransferase involved in cellulose biosynthesis
LALAAQWRQLAEATGADIFLTPDWFDLWWKHFGMGRKFRCLVARDRGGALTGVLPFAIETVWAGPLPVRVARFAGVDHYNIVFALPVIAAHRAALLGNAVRHLLARGACDVVSFTPVSERSDIAALLEPQAFGADIAITRAVDGSHVVFDLPKSFETYLAALSKNRRKQFRRDQRALVEAYGAAPRVVRPDAAAFDDFIRRHAAQWQAVGKGGHFSDWQGSREFHLDFAERCGGDGRIRLYELVGRDGPLASRFTIEAGGRCHARLTARALDPDVEKASAGIVSLILTVEQLIAEGVGTIEAGRGEYDHKISCGGVNVGLERVLLTRATAASALRLRWLKCWADAVNLFYYRLWFLRLRPRLGLRPGALWRGWTRTRL